MVHKINTADMEVGEQVTVQGTVQYSHVATQIAGEELREANARRVQRGWSPYKGPLTLIELANARIVYKDAQHPTIAEQWLQETFFESRSDASGGYHVILQNRLNTLPPVVQVDAQRNATQIRLDGELARGLHVMCVCKVYRGTRGHENNKGVGLNLVALLEPVRYVAPSGAQVDLQSALGIKMDKPIVYYKASQGNEADEPARPASQPQQAPARQQAAPQAPAPAPAAAPIQDDGWGAPAGPVEPDPWPADEWGAPMPGEPEY